MGVSAERRKAAEEHREKVHTLWQYGYTDSEIVKATGLNKSTVCRLRRKLGLSPRARRGAPDYSEPIDETAWVQEQKPDISDSEIIRSYRNSVDPVRHCMVLAQLNGCRPLTIATVLYRHGEIDLDQLKLQAAINREWCDREAVEAVGLDYDVASSKYLRV